MSVRFLPKYFGRRIVVFLGILLMGIVLIVAAMQVVLLKINQNRDTMVTKLKQELGLPITLETIEAHWFGLSLGVSVKHVVVLDPAVPIGFLAIKKIDLFPDITRLLFKDEFYLKKIVLEDLRLVIGWDDKNQVSILGLKGESLPTSIDYKALTALLSKLQTIVVYNAEIEWRGPSVQIKQSLRGEFDWIASKTIDWKFVGTQQLQIRDNVKSPESDFNLSVAPNLQNIVLNMDGRDWDSQCDFQSSEGQQWQVNCKAETKQINLAEIRRFYQPVKTDFPLLQWLYGALTKGKMTESKFQLVGPIDALKATGEIQFKSTHFEYTPGWPKIEKARGSVLVESDQVTVKLLEGAILGSPIQSATARILPIGKVEKPVVYVEGEIESTLEKGLLFLQKSPLKKSVAEHLEIINPRGPMHLNLKCDIPLNTQPLKVNGSVLVNNGRVDIPDWHLGLNQLKGTFQFTNAGLEGSNIKAALEHVPITMNVKTLTDAKQKKLEITATGLLNSAFLQQQFSIPLLQKLQGASLFTLVVQKPLDASKAVWSLNSDLQGMKIDLPDFLGKTESESRPITLKVGTEIKGERKIEFHFDRTVVTTNFSEKPLKWQLDGPSIKGTFSGATENAKHIDIELKYLKLSPNQLPSEIKITSNLKTFITDPLNFYCEDLQYGQARFGEVSFKLIPAAYGFKIENLTVETPQSELTANGEWHLEEKGVYTNLKGKMTSTNIGTTLSRWDYPTAIRESSGVIQFDLHWPKHPFQFKLGILDGNAELKFDKGRILGVNPGIGRILGLLNFQNIGRRLQLDFSDLLKKGFVFDTLKSNFKFQNGIATTDKLSIDGPSAKISLSGKANMNTKAIDLEMAVTPHIEVGLPLAAAIAVGNPAVGAGLWIIDKLTGSKINKITRHHYRVTGTWDAPSINEAN